MNFISKGQRIESFLLNLWVAMNEPNKVLKAMRKAKNHYRKELKTDKSKAFGFHEVHEAVEYY